MEMEKVPAAGYEIKGLWISGLQRQLSLKNLSFPLKVVKSLMDARKIIKEFEPDVAIGTGGYASGPLLYMAYKKGIPALIQEQNSYAGITNKLLAKKVNKVCVASDNMGRFFPLDKIVFTGNPVRQDLIGNQKQNENQKQAAMAHFGFESDQRVLLVLGGSLGARRMNQLIASELPSLEKEVQVLWQCGKLYYEQYKQHDSSRVRVLAFVDRMDLAYAASDMIISRAGAGTISELALVGKPVLFIPSPHVAEDHQTKNALAVQEKEAALMIREQDLERNFQTMWNQLCNDSDLREKLSANFRKLARPNATSEIVDQVKKLIDV